jgi:hypothetical protein
VLTIKLNGKRIDSVFGKKHIKRVLLKQEISQYIVNHWRNNGSEENNKKKKYENNPICHIF